MLGVESVWTVSGSFYCVKFKCIKLLTIQTEFFVLLKGQFPLISLKKTTSAETRQKHFGLIAPVTKWNDLFVFGGKIGDGDNNNINDDHNNNAYIVLILTDPNTLIIIWLSSTISY